MSSLIIPGAMTTVKKTITKKTSSRKKDIYCKYINEEHRRRTKLNLSEALSEWKENIDVQPRKNEILEMQRNKIKAEYHRSPGFVGVSKFEKKDIRRIEFSSKEFSPNQPTLREQLSAFAIKHNPTANMFQDMLKLMESNGVVVPKMEPIISNNDTFEILSMMFGQYLNFGVHTNLVNISRKFTLPADIALDIGTFVIKSMPSETDPKPNHHLIILGKIRKFVFNEAFVIGVYRGLFPSMIIGNQILKPLVDELKSFEEAAVSIEGINHKIRVSCFIADPLANSLITCTALPNSISGCSKCNVQGNLQFNKELYTSYPAGLPPGSARNDDDFKLCIPNGHHLGVPILSELDLGLVSQFSIDYRSIICEGVMKSLLTLWTRGRLDYRINKEQCRRISAELLLIGMNLPIECKEKPKTMEELDSWTPLDYRNFLLYYGPIVLKTVLPEIYYQHFIKLHQAVLLMVNESNYHIYGSFMSGTFLSRFCDIFAVLYGPEFIDYNFHNLLHIEDMCMRLGALDDISGFKFENHLNHFKTVIDTPLHCLGKSLMDHTNLLFENKINKLNNKYPMLPSPDTLVLENFTLTTTFPNNFAMTKTLNLIKIEKIVEVHDVGIEIVGRQYETSAELRIVMQHVDILPLSWLSETKVFQVEDIACKLFPIETTRGLRLGTL